MEKKYEGLSTIEAEKLLKQYGKNILPHKKPVGDIIILFDQLKSPLIYILLFAGIISIVLSDLKDAAIIFAAVILNTFLGFYQERKAQKALFALKQILNPQAKVFRDGTVVTIDVSQVVPGDIILITSGDRIPADGYVFEEVNLLVNEAVLTGESVPVTKTAHKDGGEITKASLVFTGTTVIAGRGKMLVTKTALTTEFGKIASELSITKEEETPLQEKIASFARFLAIIFLGMSVFIFVLGIATGKTFIEMFTTSVAVAVAAIPEGMAVALTAILAIGMQRILKRKALVRKLVAAEALGSTTVIATDKTGTLTLGVMSVVKTDFVDKEKAFEVMVYANNREDALEIALWEYAQKNKIDPEKLEEENPRIKELPFDSHRRYMATLNSKGETTALYIKGAPEVIIENSNMSQTDKEKWMQKVEKWASQGFRLLGFGYKFHKGTTLTNKDIANLNWVGLIGITDPVRETVKEALVATQEAGIKTKVITGDYAGTSIAVLHKLGLHVSGNQIVEGEELEKLSASQFEQKASEAILFARVSPSQKLKIVQALQSKGEVVALVGDGVNDAPAIKAANIGIVVEGASDVARQTADMVLLDSNFATIVSAIEEGRGIYQNVKKVIFFQMAGSFSEIVLVMSALFLGLPLPLAASQILWINIVTEGFPNLALTIDPKEKNLLKYPPVNPKAQLFDTLLKAMMILISTSTGLLLLGLFIVIYEETRDLSLSQTVVFTSLGITMLLYVFSLRTLKNPLLASNIFANLSLVFAVFLSMGIQLLPLYNPFLQSFLGTVPLFGKWWGYVMVVPVIIILEIEFVKIAFIIPRKKATF